MDAIAFEGIWYDGDEGFDYWDDPGGYNVPTNSLYPGWTEEVLEYLEEIEKVMPVFCVEYAQDIGTDTFATTAYNLAQSEGFICYCTGRSLGQLSTIPYPPGYFPIDYW
jgi:endo-alpha-1,4-polygalactosaminidase (GH114 family)